MADIRIAVKMALESVLQNSWLVELPPNPTFPAILYEVDSEQEEQWCWEGGYDQHNVTVVLLAKDADWFATVESLVRAAMEAVEGFMFEISSGDGDYEDDPNVFARVILFRLRSPRY